MHHGTPSKPTGTDLALPFEWLHNSPLCGSYTTYYPTTSILLGIHSFPIFHHKQPAVNILVGVALKGIWLTVSLGTEVLSIRGSTGWGGRTGYQGRWNRGPWAASHTHLCHIKQEQLQVKGCGAGGHLVGDPTNAIAHLGTEWELTGSAVLGGNTGAKPPACADTQQSPIPSWASMSILTSLCLEGSSRNLSVLICPRSS